MSRNVRTQIGKVIGKSLNGYHTRVKPKIDELKFKEQYQGKIIDCMVGEVDDNYIETPLTDENVVKLEHSKEGVVKIPQIKGKTILIDADGNETDTPGEGCRLVSVGEEEDNKLIILSKNKNLFNGNYTFDKWDNKVTEYIYIKGLTSISHSTTSMDDGALISTSRFYDKNKNLIKDNGNTWNNRKLDIPNGAEYIQHSVKPTVDINTFMVESGSIITNYVPYQSHKTEILLKNPLRKLPNGVCDEIVGNKIIRRVGIRIFDGSENWMGGLVSDNLFRCHTYDFDGVKHNGLISNIFAENHWEKGFYIHPHKLVYCTIENVTSVAEFKEWMSIKKPTLLYELAEPIIEELPNSITIQGFDDTTMYIENSITPTVSYGYNALIPYKEELRTQKEEVETNTLDIENNIIPYLMDMEYNLMLMEDN